MKDMGWVASMGKPGGGRNDVDPRFITLFSVFNMTFPEEESLFHIYNSILVGHTQNFSTEIRECIPTLTKVTMELYKYVYNIVAVTEYTTSLGWVFPCKA